MMRRIFHAVLCAAFFVISNSASAFDKPPFPRLAVSWIANQNYQDSTIQSQLALGSIAIIGIWPGWQNGRGVTVEQVIESIKKINQNTLVFDYIINDNVPANGGGVFSELYSKVSAMNWWLYKNGTSGSIIQLTSGYNNINNTLFTQPDANGDTWVDYFAKWAVKQYYTPSPSLDGFITDNVFWKPFYSADFNRDGTTDDLGSATTQSWYRQGFIRHFNMLNKLMPGKYQLGNIGGWGAPEADLTGYQGLINGGVIEGLIGHDWSTETWATWSYMMSWYRKAFSALAEPKLGIFAQVGTATDYQSIRYGLGSCLLDDGYYQFGTLAGNNGDAPYFDEYDNAGKGKGYLGYATSSPPTAPYQNGVYRRDFENGIVLVNPRGNGQQTITLETDYKKIAGTQAPTVNNGQTTKTVTLNDRDGIILLRLSTVKRPGAPTSLTVN